MPQSSIAFYKYLESNFDGVDIEAVPEGAGSAEAKILPNKIVVDLDGAASGNNVDIETPFGFKVVDMKTIHGDTTAADVQAQNGGAAITDVLSSSSTDEEVTRAGTISDANNEFKAGDDDLELAVTTAAFTGKVILDIIPQ